MIQGGGMNAKLEEKPTRAPIENEAKNGLKNDAGTIAMARTQNPHSASAQFFINLEDNRSLNYPSPDGWGYAVFGKVTGGMDVVRKIGKEPTATRGYQRDVPITPILIQSARQLPEKSAN
jgi:peptidyl-prolyl cis-trans isomerase A (cyclophilin A)